MERRQPTRLHCPSDLYKGRKSGDHSFDEQHCYKNVKMGKIAIIFLVAFSGGIVFGADEIQTSWSNLVLGKESGREMCGDNKEECFKNLILLKKNLNELDNQNLLKTDSIINKRFKSRLVEFGNIYSCSCGLEKNIIDLGQSYFPRYVLSGKCQLTCRAGSQMCQPKYYSVTVLKEKNDDDSNSFANMIHPKLKDSWTPKEMNVVVGCECGP